MPAATGPIRRTPTLLPAHHLTPTHCPTSPTKTDCVGRMMAGRQQTAPPQQHRSKDNTAHQYQPGARPEPPNPDPAHRRRHHTDKDKVKFLLRNRILSPHLMTLILESLRGRGEILTRTGVSGALKAAARLLVNGDTPRFHLLPYPVAVTDFGLCRRRSRSQDPCLFPSRLNWGWAPMGRAVILFHHSRQVTGSRAPVNVYPRTVNPPYQTTSTCGHPV